MDIKIRKQCLYTRVVFVYILSGIYAVAFLTDLCHRLDPASCQYASSKELRQHLIECFEEGRMSPFPSTSRSKGRPMIKDLHIYCHCRLPYVLEHKTKREVQADEDKHMIQCDLCNNWYHITCVSLTTDEFREFSKPEYMWTCEFKGCSKYIDDILNSDSD